MGSQVKAMEEARRKAAILKYNKFRLPEINKQNKRKWTATSFADTAFAIPDGQVMMAPKGNPQRNKKPLPQQQKPSQPKPQHNGHGGSNGFQKNKNGSKGKKPLKIQKKASKNSKKNNTVPPPPKQQQPSYQQQPYQQQPYQQPNGGQQGNGAYSMYGQNPATNWQQQALGYGSNPNLSYQQQPYQQPNNSMYQQQQRQYGQQNKNYYNNPYKPYKQ